MVNNPLVSIIIPIFNCEKSIIKAINSVLYQTLEDIEVICVDDGSSDGSGNLIKEMSVNDPRIKYYYQHNAGAGVARNKGLRESNGQFVCFLDADDWYPNEDSLRQLYVAAEEHGCDIAGGCIEVECRGKLITYESDSFKGRSFERLEVISYRDFQEPYFYTRFLFRRSLIEDMEIYFPSYRRFQDPPFFVKAMICAGSFVAVPVISYHYNSGYKIIEWTNEKLCDWCSGVLDVLEMAHKNNLIDLYKRIIEDFDTKELICALACLSRNGCSESVKFVMQMNDSIDWSLIGTSKSFSLDALKYFDGEKKSSFGIRLKKRRILLERKLKSLVLKRLRWA